MDYVVGIDGGGTKTKLTVCDLDGNIIYSTVSGPSNILSSGFETAKESISQVIKEGMIESKYGIDNCISLCIGVAGAGREEIKKQLHQIVRDTGYKGKLIITHDAETALVGGTGGDEGILIIAGTGAICFGKTKEGRVHRVSGWGHIIGDEGSAYSLGVKVLNAVMKAYDGRGRQTVLTKNLLDYMDINSEEEIINLIYKDGITKQHIASMAILIDDACQLGDEVALEIVSQTVDELYECLEACIRKLNFADKNIKVIINGGVLVKNTYINKGFRDKIKDNYPLIEITTMIHDAAYGAAIMAIGNIDKTSRGREL